MKAAPACTSHHNIELIMPIPSSTRPAAAAPHCHSVTGSLSAHHIMPRGHRPCNPNCTGRGAFNSLIVSLHPPCLTTHIAHRYPADVAPYSSCSFQGAAAAAPPYWAHEYSSCSELMRRRTRELIHRPPHLMASTHEITARASSSATQQLAPSPLKQQQQQAVNTVAADQRRRELPPGLAADRLPRHVSMIMDGNARWAQMQGLERPKGHAAGVKALMELIYVSSEWGLSAFSVFLFSTENWNRSQEEVSSLMEIYEKNLIEHLDNFLKYNIKVKVIGDKEQLSQSFQNTIKEVEKKTSQCTGMKAAFAINYGGRLDMIQAFQQVAKKLQQGRIKLEDVSEEAIDNELWTSWMENTQTPDLLIRTSGEQRISNFFLWQAAYSEIMFLDVCFPALNETIYSKALVDYQKRDRRYGKRKQLQLAK